MSNDSRAAAGQRESLKIVLRNDCGSETADDLLSDQRKRCEKFEFVRSTMFLCEIN